MSATHQASFESDFSSDLDAEKPVPDVHPSGRTSRKLALLLEGGSLALFIIFLVRLLPLMMEVKPLDNAWQGDLVDVFVNQGLYPFLGFVLLHLAVHIQPRQQYLRKRLRLARQLAVIPAIGYLLLMPLQITSSIAELNQAKAQKVKYLSQETRLADIRDSILNASSVQDINVRLQSLLEPSLSADQLTQPIAQLRASLLKDVTTRQQEVTKRLKENTDNINPFGQEIIHVGTALGWALAFAAGAVPWGSRTTLLEKVRRR